jgi:hypothetical protein
VVEAYAVRKAVDFWRWDVLAECRYTGKAVVLGGTDLGVAPRDIANGVFIRDVASWFGDVHVLAHVDVKRVDFWQALCLGSSIVGAVCGEEVSVCDEDLHLLAWRAGDQPWIEALGNDIPGLIVVALFANGIRQARQVPGKKPCDADKQYFICDFRDRPHIRPQEAWMAFELGGRACWAMEDVDEWVRNPERELVMDKGIVRYRVQDAWNDEFVRNAAWYQVHGSAFMRLR